MENRVNDEQVVPDVAVLAAPYVGGAHIVINDGVGVIVDHSVHDRPDLNHVKDPSIVVEITSLPSVFI